MKRLQDLPMNLAEDIRKENNHEFFLYIENPSFVYKQTANDEYKVIAKQDRLSYNMNSWLAEVAGKVICEFRPFKTNQINRRNQMDIIELANRICDLGEKYPNAIYQYAEEGQCNYGKGKVANGPDEEGCIIGQAMPEDIRKKVCNMDDYAINILPEYMDYEETDVNERLLSQIQCVQDAQDSGKPWGYAVQNLMKVLEDNIIISYLEKGEVVYVWAE